MNKIKADEKCRERILAASEPARRFRPFKVFPVIAAVFALMVGTAVYAAQSGLLGIIFEKDRDYSGFEGLTGEMNISSLETYYDGTDITPVGYAADSYNIYCVFRMDLDEPLPDDYDYYGEEYIDGWGHFSIDMMRTFESFSDDGTSGGGTDIRFIREDSDTFYCIFTAYCIDKMHGTIPLKFTCLNLSGIYIGKKGMISFDNLISEKIFTADFTVEIPECEPVSIKSGGITFSVTPCGITADTEGLDYKKLISYKDPGLLSGAAYVKMKSGETVKCSNSFGKIYNTADGFSFEGGTNGPTRMRGTFRTRFEYPVDPEDIEYLYVGGREYYP